MAGLKSHVNHQANFSRDDAFIRVTQATRHAVSIYGGLEFAAQHTGVGVTSLSNYQNPHREETVPGQAISELESGLDYPVITGVLAEIQDFNLIPIIRAACPLNIDDALHKVAAELGDVHKAVMESKSDGTISLVEWRHIEKEALEAKHSADELLALARTQILEMEGKVTPLKP